MTPRHAFTPIALVALVLGAASTASAAPRLAEPLGKVDGTVRELGALAGGGPHELKRFAATHGIRLDGAGEPRALVVIETATAAAGEIGPLEKAGAQVVQTADSAASAWVPLRHLAAIAALPRVLRVRRPVDAVWSVSGAGAALIGAGEAQAGGFRGQGVKIGVVDVFMGYESHLGRELPAQGQVVFRSFISGGGAGDSSHGVQVAQILHDIAPDATLYLAAMTDDVGYRNAVSWLISQGVSIINHSGGFGLFGDLRGNGPLSGTVASAAASGVLYVEAAGNEAQSHYESTFQDTNRNGFAEFAPGVERITFQADASALDLRVDLNWDDWGGNPADPRPTTDYDVCLYDSGGAEVACSREPQNGAAGEAPFEVISYRAPSAGTYSIGVKKVSGADLHYEVTLDPNYSFGALNMPASSIIVPADSASAFTVGATGLADRIESYSSRGPTNDGRTKPDLVAPDGVDTFDGLFFGTSAGTPHVAGAAALLLSSNPALTAGDLAARLRASAVQVPGDTIAGVDNTYGAGRVHIDLGAATPPPPTPTPPRSGGGGGGGCRLVPGAPDGATLLVAVAAVLAYAAWLARRS